MKKVVQFYLLIFLFSFKAVAHMSVPLPPEAVVHTKVIQETKVLRHYPSLAIVTLLHSRNPSQFYQGVYYFETLVMDLDVTEDATLYRVTSTGWFEAQLAHYYATGWCIETFPPLNVPRGTN
jgi:hypothetical protein